MARDGVSVPSQKKYLDSPTAHIHATLCNLVHAARKGDHIYMDIGMDSGAYSGTGMSYRNVKKVTDYLISKGYVDFDIPALPVHDSFVIEEEHEEACWDAMKAAFCKRFDQEIPIDITDILTRTKRILNGPVVAAHSGLSKQMADDIHVGICEGDPSNFVRGR